MKIDEYLNLLRVVYVMADWGKPGDYKIGCTSNFTRRYQSSASCKKAVCLLPVPEGMNIYMAERLVHEFFRDKNIYAECFSLSEYDLEILGRMRITHEGIKLNPHGD